MNTRYKIMVEKAAREQYCQNITLDLQPGVAQNFSVLLCNKITLEIPSRVKEKERCTCARDKERKNRQRKKF